MTSRQALAKMFMYASITHCQGKITQRALALWHLHSWHLDVPPQACNSRREIQGPKGPVLFCQSNGETIANNSALKKLAERIYTATKKEYEYYITSRSSRNSHHQKLDTCQVFVSLLVYWFWQAHPCCKGNPTLVKLIASACGLLINPLKTTWYSFCWRVRTDYKDVQSTYKRWHRDKHWPRCLCMPVLRTAKGKSPKERLPCGIYILGT